MAETVEENVLWKTIKDYPMYQVSNLGGIRKKVRNKWEVIPTHYTSNSAAIKVFLRKDADSEYAEKRVDQLVWGAFKPDPVPDLRIKHLDGDRKNNSVENLTRSNPVIEAYASDGHTLLGVYQSSAEAAIAARVPQSTFCYKLKRKDGHINGLLFRLREKENVYRSSDDAKLFTNNVLDSEWRDIKGFPGCQISSAGNVRRLNGNKWKTVQLIICRGRQCVRLDKAEKDEQAVDRLVWDAFKGIPIPLNAFISHLDGNIRNNCPDNLACRYIQVYDVDGETLFEEYPSVYEASEGEDLCPNTVKNLLAGGKSTKTDLIFRYKTVQ